MCQAFFLKKEKRSPLKVREAVWQYDPKYMKRNGSEAGGLDFALSPNGERQV